MTEMEFFSINCEQLQIDCIDNGYARFIYNNYIFYTDKRYFSDPQYFPTSSSQGRLYIMAHQFADGSYWVHWMKLVLKATQKNRSKKTITLQPHTPPEVTQKDKNSSHFYGLASLLFISIVLFNFIYPQQGNSFIFVISIFLSVAFVFMRLIRGSKVKRLSNNNVRDLTRWIEIAKQRKAGDFLALEGRHATQDFASRLRQFTSQRPEELDIVEGTIEVISKIQTHRGPHNSAPTNAPLNEQINLTCMGRCFNFLWQSGGTFYGTDPILWKKHAPFLVNNDQVVFFYGEIHYLQAQKIIPRSAVKPQDPFITNNIFYLYNKTDNSLYRSLLTDGYKTANDEYFTKIPLLYIKFIPTH